MISVFAGTKGAWPLPTYRFRCSRASPTPGTGVAPPLYVNWLMSAPGAPIVPALDTKLTCDCDQLTVCVVGIAELIRNRTILFRPVSGWTPYSALNHPL